MRFSMRAGEGGGVVGAWAYWLRVACLSLFGFWFLVPSALGEGDQWSAAQPLFTHSGCTPNSDRLPVAECACSGRGGVLSVPPWVQYPTAITYGLCADDAGVALGVDWQCAEGFSPDSGGNCVSVGCSNLGGLSSPFELVLHGTSSCASAPTTVCTPAEFGSPQCRAEVRRAGCTWFAAQGDAPSASFISGELVIVTSGPCPQGAPVVTYAQAPVPGFSTSGGGVGVIKGMSGTLSASDINLARIATNTAKIADGVLGGGSSTSGCGGPSDPPCKLDETGVSAAGQEASVAQATAESSMGSALDAQASGLSLGAMPDFTGGSPSTRWTLTFLPFLAASGPSECKVQWDVPLVGQVFKAGYDFCGLADSVKQFLYWAFAVGTAFSMWNMVYRTRGGE